MKECGIPEDLLIGYMCRRIPGTGKESCYLWQAAQRESAQTIGDLRTVIERHPECPFQKEVLVYIEQRRRNNGKC